MDKKKAGFEAIVCAIALLLGAIFLYMIWKDNQEQIDKNASDAGFGSTIEDPENERNKLLAGLFFIISIILFIQGAVLLAKNKRDNQNESQAKLYQQVLHQSPSKSPTANTQELPVQEHSPQQKAPLPQFQQIQRPQKHPTLQTDLARQQIPFSTAQQLLSQEGMPASNQNKLQIETDEWMCRNCGNMMERRFGFCDHCGSQRAN